MTKDRSIEKRCCRRPVLLRPAFTQRCGGALKTSPCKTRNACRWGAGVEQEPGFACLAQPGPEGPSRPAFSRAPPGARGAPGPRIVRASEAALCGGVHTCAEALAWRAVPGWPGLVLRPAYLRPRGGGTGPQGSRLPAIGSRTSRGTTRSRDELSQDLERDSNPGPCLVPAQPRQRLAEAGWASASARHQLDRRVRRVLALPLPHHPFRLHRPGWLTG